jgi:hypothetical protein
MEQTFWILQCNENHSGARKERDATEKEIRRLELKSHLDAQLELGTSGSTVDTRRG